MPSDAVFPSTPGLTWTLKASPTFSTVRQRNRARRETRLVNDPYPLWSFELSYEFLRDYVGSAQTATVSSGANRSASNPQGYSDLALIVGFFCRQLSTAESFLLDPAMLTGREEESHAVGVLIGTGDGVTTAFQLQRHFGGFMDIVEAPRGPAKVNVGGVPASGFAQSPTGLVTFASPPAPGAVITANFHWAFRVFFAEDSLTPEMFSFQLYELKSVKLIQDRA